MTEEKHAIFISLSHDCQLLDKGHYSIVFIEIITCNTLNRHLVAKDQGFLRGYANCGKNDICSF